MPSDNRLPLSNVKGFIFFTHFSGFSVNTELVCRNNFAKNSLNRFLDGTIVDRQVSTAFAFELTSGQWTRGSENWCPLSPNSIIINSARSHFPPGLSLSVEYHFVSDPGPRNDQRHAGNLFANKVTSVELAIHSFSLSFILHMMSLNIDMKIIRPWNCSGSLSGSLILFMNFGTSWMSCNVVNPERYFTRIPLTHHQFCPMFHILMNF